MGEGTGNDELLMPHIAWANIACGYHAGDVATMQQTVQWAVQYSVAVGAHPSFPDKENFGRSEMRLESKEVYDLLIQQLVIIKEITTRVGIKLNHVKPHGALYNMSAKDAVLAATIARAVRDFDTSLFLIGLSGSHSISEAKAIGIRTVSEVFADRTYQDDGRLTPRSQPGALIDNAGDVVKQVLQMIEKGAVTTLSGNKITVLAETVCIHGDGEHAVEFAKAIQKAISNR